MPDMIVLRSASWEVKRWYIMMDQELMKRWLLVLKLFCAFCH